MSIAKTVADCLQRDGVSFQVLTHPRSVSARETVRSSAVAADRLAKGVVLADERGFVMAVIPADRYVSVKTLGKKLRRNLKLVSEDHLLPVFMDCERGAIPPLGPAYGLETVVDDSLVGQPDVYFEAGDHQELIRVSGEHFLSLLRRARHGQFSH